MNLHKVFNCYDSRVFLFFISNFELLHVVVFFVWEELFDLEWCSILVDTKRTSEEVGLIFLVHEAARFLEDSDFCLFWFDWILSDLDARICGGSIDILNELLLDHFWLEKFPGLHHRCPSTLAAKCYSEPIILLSQYSFIFVFLGVKNVYQRLMLVMTLAFAASRLRGGAGG